MGVWPQIDERAVLTLACCGEQLTTRVESFEDRQCIVHLPVHHCNETATAAAGNVLSWFSGEKCWTRPVEIVGYGGYPRAALWVLRANGDAESWQRRDFVRVNTALPAAAFSGETRIAELEAVDISEGGLRCTMSTAACKALPLLFNVRFVLDGIEVRIATQVAWASTNPDDDGAEAVVGLEFQSLSAHNADIIRTYVFRLQIALRRQRLVTQ
jgi:hypothetical protein